MSNRSNLPACLLAIKVAKDDMLTLIGADPCEFAKGKLGEYVKSIPDDCSTKGDISIIVNSIGEIEKLLKRVIRAQDKILNFCGISPEWHAADTVSRFLKTTAAYLEDIQLLEMSGGIVELTVAQWLGELMYQKDIRIWLVPYIIRDYIHWAKIQLRAPSNAKKYIWGPVRGMFESKISNYYHSIRAT